MSEENVEIVRRLLAANRSGPPEATVEIVQYVEDMNGTFRTWRNEPSGIEEVGDDAVLVNNTFYGVGRGSGAEVDLRSVIIFVLSEGKVLRCLSYPTRDEALEAAGLSE